MNFLFFLLLCIIQFVLLECFRSFHMGNTIFRGIFLFPIQFPQYSQFCYVSHKFSFDSAACIFPVKFICVFVCCVAEDLFSTIHSVLLPLQTKFHFATENVCLQQFPNSNAIIPTFKRIIYCWQWFLLDFGQKQFFLHSLSYCRIISFFTVNFFFLEKWWNIPKISMTQKHYWSQLSSTHKQPK